MGIFNIFVRQKKEELIEVDKDLRAIVGFFRENVNSNIMEMAGLFKSFVGLRRKFIYLRAIRNEYGIKKNLMEQIKLFDKILECFEAFELDTDITGERVKKIAKALKTEAEKYQINQKWLDLVKKGEEWTFDW